MSMKFTHITFFTDGGARGNPGPAGSGAFSPELGEFKEYIGEATNNQAEYHALVMAMEAAVAYKQHHPELGEVNVFMDSELIVKQMNREYKVRNKELQTYFIKVWNLCGSFKRVTFTHVPREQNQEADRLVNEAIDEAIYKALTN